MENSVTPGLVQMGEERTPETQQELVMSHVGSEMHVRHQEGRRVDLSILGSRA